MQRNALLSSEEPKIVLTGSRTLNLTKFQIRTVKKKGELHDGFLKIFQLIAANAAYSAAVTRCAAANKMMYFTGHSLGGALATLGAYSFITEHAAYDKLKIHLATFGSPRVGDPDWADDFKELLPGRGNRYESVKKTRFLFISPPGDHAVPGDIVPRVPPMTDTTIRVSALLLAGFDWGSELAQAFSTAVRAGYRHVGRRFQLDCDDINPIACHNMAAVYWTAVNTPGAVRNV